LHTLSTRERFFDDVQEFERKMHHLRNAGQDILGNRPSRNDNIDKYMTEKKMTNKARAKLSPSPGSRVYCEKVVLRNNRTFASFN